MFSKPHHKPVPVSPVEMSEARFRRFLRELNTYEHQLAYEETLNALLDLYSAWMKSHEPWLKIRVVMLAFELHRMNPAFECSLSFKD